VQYPHVFPAIVFNAVFTEGLLMEVQAIEKELVDGPFGQQVVLETGAKMPFSPGFAAQGFIFVSGQLALDEFGSIVNGGICEQTTQCFQNLQNILSECDATLKDIVKMNVWLTNVEDFQAFNKIYQEILGDTRPSRTALRSDLLLERAVVEIDAIAYKPRPPQTHLAGEV